MSTIKLLPFTLEIETTAVLKKLAKAHQALAELKGIAASIPNEGILISTLSLQEAKDSSEIENIITTHDDLYRSDSIAKLFVSVAAKEVHNYASALHYGFKQVKAHGLLTNANVLHIQATIEENSAGFRKLPGTALKNDLTGATVYTPPQHADEIITLRPIWSALSMMTTCVTGIHSQKWRSSITSLKASTLSMTAMAEPAVSSIFCIWSNKDY